MPPNPLVPLSLTQLNYVHPYPTLTPLLMLLEFFPSSQKGSPPRDDLFLPDSCPSPTFCDFCLSYLPHPNAPELEESFFFSSYPSLRSFLVPDLNLEFRIWPLVIDLSLARWPFSLFTFDHRPGFSILALWSFPSRGSAPLPESRVSWPPLLLAKSVI